MIEVPQEIRQAAIKAIEEGKNLEIVAEANKICDEINKQVECDCSDIIYLPVFV